ncbi:hypothetical protein EH183_37020 [Streptomyces sp. CB01881]|nr:hypothetical protein C2142_36990 [Streptomyces sp. CB01881]TYC69802.1 hypothetical protein EH183_37020 [Streptomyces sp. CB01881]
MERGWAAVTGLDGGGGRRPARDRPAGRSPERVPRERRHRPYTDGLVESRERDTERGAADLLRVLSEPAASLKALCDTAMKVLLPDHRTDDAALLPARTRALDPDHVADWAIEPDFAQVAHARRLAADRLAVWGLEETAFVTELVVSELVTNAIKYGQPPIRLRLIRNTSLICEVSDGSDTSPHLRRARTFDEGGRGLMLVAQLTQGWGTRHTTNGKTIWCAQTLASTPRTGDAERTY